MMLEKSCTVIDAIQTLKNSYQSDDVIIFDDTLIGRWREVTKSRIEQCCTVKEVVKTLENRRKPTNVITFSCLCADDVKSMVTERYSGKAKPLTIKQAELIMYLFDQSALAGRSNALLYTFCCFLEDMSTEVETILCNTAIEG